VDFFEDLCQDISDTFESIERHLEKWTGAEWDINVEMGASVPVGPGGGPPGEPTSPEEDMLEESGDYDYSYWFEQDYIYPSITEGNRSYGVTGAWHDIYGEPGLQEDFFGLDWIFDGVDLISLYSDTDLTFKQKLAFTPLILGPVTTSALRKGSRFIRKKVVIGETMDRVVGRARKIGAKYYNPRTRLPAKANKAQIKRALSNNYKWLRHKVKKGYDIIDMGIDKSRKSRGIFYEAEKKWLKIWGR